jgi:hypothetical protein
MFPVSASRARGPRSCLLSFRLIFRWTAQLAHQAQPQPLGTPICPIRLWIIASDGICGFSSSLRGREDPRSISPRNQGLPLEHPQPRSHRELTDDGPRVSARRLGTGVFETLLTHADSKESTTAQPHEHPVEF